MNANEAHDYTMEVVRDLQAAGIAVTVRLYSSTEGRTANWPKHYADVLAKYGGQPGRASPEKWCNVNLKPHGEEQGRLIWEKQKHLGWMGIRFDSGGGCGGRDWELDWSFRLVEGGPDTEREAQVDMVNGLIDELEKGTLIGEPFQKPPEPPDEGPSPAA